MTLKIFIPVFAAACALFATTSCSQRAEQNTAEETESATGTVDPAEIGQPVHVLAEGETINPVEGKLVVIDFNATWCGPCRQFAPTFEAVAEEMADKALFYSVDVDQHPELAQKYGVQSIPMVVYLKPTGQYESTVGVLSKEDFTATIQENL